MSGSENLTRRQECAIGALLCERTHEMAAKKSGVSAATLRRWLRLPAFRSAYREARRAAVESAIGQLQQATTEAVEALRRNIKCGAAGHEIRAALGILDHAVQGIELMDLLEEVENVKAQVAALEERQR